MDKQTDRETLTHWTRKSLVRPIDVCLSVSNLESFKEKAMRFVAADGRTFSGFLPSMESDFFLSLLRIEFQKQEEKTFLVFSSPLVCAR